MTASRSVRRARPAPAAERKPFHWGEGAAAFHPALGGLARKGLALATLMLSLGCERFGWSETTRADQESSPTRGSLRPVQPVLPAAPRTVSRPPRESSTPEGFERASVVGITPTERGHAIVLQAGQRALPIYVGESEGLSIQLRLAGERFHRPLTHDLMDAVMEELGGTVESVRVERFEDDVFYSVVVLAYRTERHELDSRTSDAIALALGHQVPIFVRTSVLETTSVDLGSLLPTPGLPMPEPSGADGEPPSSEPPLDPDTVSL